MPPYRREIAASSDASKKLLKDLEGNPYSNSVVSSNGNGSPKSLVRAVAAAAEITLCPLVYSGNGGV